MSSTVKARSVSASCRAGIRVTPGAWGSWSRWRNVGRLYRLPRPHAFAPGAREVVLDVAQGSAPSPVVEGLNPETLFGIPSQVGWVSSDTEVAHSKPCKGCGAPCPRRYDRALPDWAKADTFHPRRLEDTATVDGWILCIPLCGSLFVPFSVATGFLFAAKRFRMSFLESL